MKRKFVDFKVLTASLCCAVVMGVISFVFLKNARIIVRIQGVFPLLHMVFATFGYAYRFCI